MHNAVIFPLLVSFLWVGCKTPQQTSEGKAVFGKDNRQATRIYKGVWSPIGFLRIENKYKGKSGCTATLVAPSIILTASHCVKGATTFLVNYDYKTEKSEASAAVEGVVAAGMDFDITHMQGEQHWYRNRQHDWAFLRLKKSRYSKSLGERFGTFKMREIKPGEVLRDLYLIGYPGDWNTTTGSVRTYNKDDCGVVGAVQDDGLFKTDCDNWKGQSGGPFLARNEHGAFTDIIGIMVSSRSKQYPNMQDVEYDTGVTLKAALAVSLE